MRFTANFTVFETISFGSIVRGWISRPNVKLAGVYLTFGREIHVPYNQPMYDLQKVVEAQGLRLIERS